MHELRLLTEIQCFGSISFWIQCLQSKQVILEQHERFQKSGYRNRYLILTSNGPLLLTIPVVGGRGCREFIKDVKIDYSVNWSKQHWRALESAYNKSAFFLYYRDSLENLFFNEPYKYLWDFNLSTLQWINKSLKAGCEFTYSLSFAKDIENNDIIDYRGNEKPGSHTSLNTPVYYQLFGNSFSRNLSVLDILFNVGPSTLEKLKTTLQLNA